MFSGTGFLGNGQIGILAENAEAGIVLPALLGQREKGGWAIAASTRGGLKDLTENCRHRASCFYLGMIR